MARPTFSAWLEGYVTFDGEVLEQYHFQESLNRRQHVATIAGVSLDRAGGREYVEIRTKFNARLWIIPFRAEQRGLANQLLAALTRALR